MKPTALIPLLITLASVQVSGVSLPAPRAGEAQANGLYQTFVDDSGNTTTKFTPLSEIPGFANGIPDALEARGSELEKRRQGCGAAVSTEDSDIANRFLLDSLTVSSDRVNLAANQVSAYVYNSAVSFICPYSSGWKYSSDIAGNWNWIKNTLCGYDKGGYAQVINGEGDWTSGYTFNGDHYC